MGIARWQDRDQDNPAGWTPWQSIRRATAAGEILAGVGRGRSSLTVAAKVNDTPDRPESAR
ncbi:MAG: hypothetical protein MZV70_67490 [Desulfobacterales bacterium]|nr:hypothetical protein [Desulfobacterales bacterium]